ncbi:ATP-dependent DNA helicase MER3 [Coemansia spiralis]|uniref:ATP-dependent DNA helicase MER3 n=1 Tax=Coemansia spiralis TaxID=417178 RepID=A0A9W8KU03_9FUNG|nr:ATP-dependent DNA helicase MER3 [Coemansia spiralis]
MGSNKWQHYLENAEPLDMATTSNKVFGAYGKSNDTLPTIGFQIPKAGIVTPTISKYTDSKRPRLQAPNDDNLAKTAMSIPPVPSNAQHPIQRPQIQQSSYNFGIFANKDTPLIAVGALSEQFAKMYPFSHFNPLQSECFNDLFCTDANLVISAPTASGKTVLLELAMFRLFKKMSSDSQRPKVLYLAPLKALCTEKAREWSLRFAATNIKCIELVGNGDSGSIENQDAQPANVTSIFEAQILCATPEKWISVVESLFLHSHFLRPIDLILIDECHMIGTKRGAFLELAVSSVRQRNKHVRVIATSAIISNISDISEWLYYFSVQPGDNRNLAVPAKTLIFGQEYRPVSLSKSVLGYDCYMPYYKFQRNLDFKLPGIINTYGSGRSTLIFCSTRGSAQDTCRFLAKNINQLNLPPTPIHLTTSFTNQLLNAVESVSKGIAYHHAGLSSSDRLRVEELFMNGSVQILCCTSTLGTGINMPAYMVIVKGTKGYINGSYQEYSTIDILQFVGRAGRPQFGNRAKAIILTDKSMANTYRTLVSGSEVLESRQPELARAIIGGIFRNEFYSTEDVASWLKSSFLAVRMKNAPSTYISSNKLDITADSDLCKGLAEMEISQLSDYFLLELSNNNTFALTDSGKCVAKHRVHPIRMAKLLAEIPANPTYRQILEFISSSGEFEDLQITIGQKSILNSMAKSQYVQFKLAHKVDSVKDKIFILLQYGLQCQPLPSSKYAAGMSLDMNRAVQLARNPAMCICEYFTLQNDFQGVIYSLKICRELHAGCSENSPAVLQQINGIGPRYAELLYEKGITNVLQLREMSAREIEYANAAYYETCAGLCNPVEGTTVTLEVAPLKYVGCAKRINVPISKRGSELSQGRRLFTEDGFVEPPSTTISSGHEIKQNDWCEAFDSDEYDDIINSLITSSTLPLE